MITLQTYSLNCPFGYISPQTSGVLNCAFGEEKELQLSYTSDVSLLNSEVRFNIALFAEYLQRPNSLSSYYFLPINSSTPLATDISLGVANISASQRLISAHINLSSYTSFTLTLRFFVSQDLGGFLSNVNSIVRKVLLSGSSSASLLLDNTPSAYNSARFIGLWVQHKTSSLSTTSDAYDYLAISPTFLNFGVMNTPVFKLEVSGLPSSVFSIDAPTIIRFSVNYTHSISKMRMWVLDYSAANDNSVSVPVAYRALWQDISSTLIESPSGTYNVSWSVSPSYFRNNNTYYVLMVAYDSSNNVVNSFVSISYLAARTFMCKPIVKSYFTDYLNAELTNNIRTSPYDRLRSVVRYTSNCSNIERITLSLDNRVVTARRNGSSYVISDNAMEVTTSGSQTTILFTFRVLPSWSGQEIFLDWHITNDAEYTSVRFQQRVEVQAFQDIAPVRLIETKLYDLSNSPIEAEDLCRYSDVSYIVETVSNDATAYKQIAIYDRGGEFYEEEAFLGELPQLSNSDLSDVDTDYVGGQARFKAAFETTFGGILASIAKKKVDIYYARHLVHVRGNTTPGLESNFYPYITVPVSDSIGDFDVIDVLGASISLEFKYREGVTPAFDTLPLLDKSAVLALLNTRSGNCDILLCPTLQSGLTEGTFIIEYIRFGVAPLVHTWSYDFSATLSVETVIGFVGKIVISSITNSTNCRYKVRDNRLTDWNAIIAVTSIGLLNAAISAVAETYEIQIIDFTKPFITVTYTYI